MFLIGFADTNSIIRNFYKDIVVFCKSFNVNNRDPCQCTLLHWKEGCL